MPIRKVPLITGEVYHIFNRGVDSRPIFIDKRDNLRALALLDYYQVGYPPVRYSRFAELSEEIRSDLIERVKGMPKAVELICFCLMPNHYHFLLKQSEEDGILRFVRNFQIGYSKYFNVKRDRLGPLFEGQFKAVRIENDEQLLHVSRYIHLNPYSSFLVRSTEDLEEYSWSSYPEYVFDKEGICRKDLIFSIIGTKEKYQKFVFDNADYQRKLKRFKHLSFE